MPRSTGSSANGSAGRKANASLRDTPKRSRRRDPVPKNGPPRRIASRSGGDGSARPPRETKPTQKTRVPKPVRSRFLGPTISVAWDGSLRPRGCCSRSDCGDVGGTPVPESLPRLLLEITDTLFLPCVGALIALCLLSFLQVGGVLVEAIDRWRFGGPWRALIDRLKMESGGQAGVESLPVAFGFPELARRELQRTPDAREKVLDDLQLRAERLLGRLSLGI